MKDLIDTAKQYPVAFAFLAFCLLAEVVWLSPLNMGGILLLAVLDLGTFILIYAVLRNRKRDEKPTLDEPTV